MTRRGKREPVTRRVPQQVRSRDRYERILSVAEALVIEGGVEAVNTRAVAAAAQIPVASLYQYFADKDEVIVALMERYADALEEQVRSDMAALSELSVASMVETVLRAFVKVYHRWPAFVMTWVRGRSSPSILAFCRARNRRLAQELFEVARSAGMTLDEATGVHAELAVEVSDRMLQVAFEKDLRGDPHVIDETIAMVTSYLESHATQRGINGASF